MRRAAAIVLGLMVLAGCGGNAPPETSPLAENAVVGGTLQMSLVKGAAVPPILVSVAGATITTNANRLGDFVLSNVPAGALELRFTGDGIAASLPVGDVAAGETVSLKILLTPQAATLEGMSRVRGTDAIVEGVVEVPGNELPANTFIVGGRTITVPPGTANGGIASLKPGTRVRVTGSVGGAGVIARQIEIR